jgi:site-specific recombinase XerD
MTDNNLDLCLENEQKEISVQDKVSRVKNYINKSLSASTRKFYRIDFIIFCTWCDSNSFIALPAEPETIALFISEQADSGIKPATLCRRLAAIRMAHTTHGFINPTQHIDVKLVLKGIKNEKGTSQDKKAPLTAERLESIIAHCPDNIIGHRDRALLILGFSGAFRRSELVALTLNDIERTPEGIKVIIRKSKTDQEGKGQTIAILNGNRFRAVDVLYKWLVMANITNGHLFRSIRRGGHVQEAVLSDNAVAVIIKSYASKAGLTIDNFSGHSLRSGFITSGAQSGADLYKLMEVSRHKRAETLIGYIRESKLFENHAGAKFV